jgi:PqqD family protein of HPr-rel-A system
MTDSLRTVAGDSTFVRSDQPLTADVDGEAILLDPTTGEFYALRGTAGAIWDLLAEPRSLDDLVSKLATTYDVDPDVCRTEVERFVGKLAESGLIHTA